MCRWYAAVSARCIDLDSDIEFAFLCNGGSGKYNAVNAAVSPYTICNIGEYWK